MARLPVVPDLGVYLREQRVAAQLSLRQLAERAGVSNPYLSQIERGLRKPSAEILGSLADALDLSAEALYVRAGILEAPRTTGAVEAAVTADPALTDRQRRTLLDLYSLFVSERRAPASPDEDSPAAPPTPDGPADPTTLPGAQPGTRSAPTPPGSTTARDDLPVENPDENHDRKETA